MRATLRVKYNCAAVEMLNRDSLEYQIAMRCINGEITEGDIYKVCKKEGANGAVATCYLIEIRNEQSLLNDLPNKLPKALLDQMIGL